MSHAASAAVSEARQWARLMEMAELGAIAGDQPDDRGVNRPCLSELDRQARRRLIGWAEAIGCTVSVDAAANLFIRREGSDAALAPVLTGSHMDSQPQGGRFDGIWGVMAGLEALEALHAAGVATRRPIEVVAWTNEEGGRFRPGCTGSMSWAGHTPPAAFAGILDPDGTSYGDALDEQLRLEADLARRPLGAGPGHPWPHAYVEAHIEQGPLLEAEGCDIGVVTGIQGSRWFTVTLAGESAHAGTAPLAGRRDAVQDMLRAVEALNELTADPSDTLRFTVGRIEVAPNTSNSVASRVSFTIDLRHPDAAVLRARGDAIEATIRQAVRACDVAVVENFHAMPVAFDPMVTEAVAAAAAAEGLRHRPIASGAFHDAQFVVPVAPTGMIFVPSRRGISHNPAEFTSPAQLAAGTRVLVRTLAALAT